MDTILQKDLLDLAIRATDAYLGIEKEAEKRGFADSQSLHDFTFYISKAHDALHRLGDIENHYEYMSLHLDKMIALSNHDDSTLADLPYAHAPKSDFGEIEEENTPSSNKDSDITPEDFEKDINGMEWHDIIDFYDEDDLIHDDDEMNEAISATSRIKKRLSFARYAQKRELAKKIKLKRASTQDTLKKRATLAARRILLKRMLMGRDKTTLSADEKNRIEKALAALGNLQSAMAEKIMPKIRQIEQKRLRGASQK